MKYPKKKLLIAVISILSISILLPVNAQNTLWYAEPTILSSKPSKGWWLDGYKTGSHLIGYKQATFSLREALKKEASQIITKNYGHHFVNPYNNTVFVVLTNVNDKVKQEFLKVMNPPEGTTVIFRKGPASYMDLEKWYHTILDNLLTLDAAGVKVLWVGISENATISLGLKEIAEEKLEILYATLKDKVPKGILIIYAQEPFELYSQSSHQDPQVAGVNAISYSDDASTYVGSTTGFYVTWDSGTKEGLLASGHCTSTTTDDYYQPDASQGSYKVGDCVDRGTGSYSDSALIELDNDEPGVPQVWTSSNDNNVTGEENYSDMDLGTVLEMMGKTSGLEYGEITAKGTASHPLYDTLYNQVEVDWDSASGDSGAPVYEKWWEPSEQIFTSTAYGLIWGGSAGESYFSPCDGIEADLNENFNFADH